jgi:hypothetical protein
MKKQLVIIGIVAILVCVGLSGCQSQGIYVEKISGAYPNCVNMTEEQMEHFPHLKESILTNTSGGDIPKAEFDELHSLVWSYDTNIIQYRNEYYEITFNVAD